MEKGKQQHSQLKVLWANLIKLSRIPSYLGLQLLINYALGQDQGAIFWQQTLLSAPVTIFVAHNHCCHCLADAIPPIVAHGRARRGHHLTCQNQRGKFILIHSSCPSTYVLDRFPIGKLVPSHIPNYVPAFNILSHQPISPYPHS